MINCPTCEKFDGHDCATFGRQPGMSICPYAVERKPRNIFEKMKSMSPEKLADFLDEVLLKTPFCNPEKDCRNEDSCVPCLLNWLKEESTDA